MTTAIQEMKDRGASDVIPVALLGKQKGLFDGAIVGKIVEDEQFVLGCGMGLGNQLRGLRGIHEFEKGIDDADH